LEGVTGLEGGGVWARVGESMGLVMLLENLVRDFPPDLWLSEFSEIGEGGAGDFLRLWVARDC
jgi:hypothetical protein